MTLFSNVIKKDNVNEGVIKKYNVKTFENIEFDLKAKDKQSKEELSTLLQTHEEKENILNSARKEAEEIKADSKNQGYEEGFEQGSTLGYEAGYNKGMEDVQAQKESAVELLMQAESKRKEMLENMEDEVIKMVISIAEKVTRLSIDDNYEKILPMIKHALNDLVTRERIVLRVNAQNSEILKNNEEQLKEICTNAKFTFLEDNSLDVTECLIDSEIETIDLNVKSQISNILKEFAKVR